MVIKKKNWKLKYHKNLTFISVVKNILTSHAIQFLLPIFFHIFPNNSKLRFFGFMFCTMDVFVFFVLHRNYIKMPRNSQDKLQNLAFMTKVQDIRMNVQQKELSLYLKTIIIILFRLIKK